MSREPLDERAWRRIAEARIEQAMREGKFSELPGFGRPLEWDVDAHDEDWWLKQKARLEGLSLLPPALQLLRDVERALDRIQCLKTEAKVRESCAALNERIRTANRSIGWGPPSRCLPVDCERIVAEWRGKFSDSSPSGQP